MQQDDILTQLVGCLVNKSASQRINESASHRVSELTMGSISLV